MSKCTHNQQQVKFTLQYKGKIIWRYVGYGWNIEQVGIGQKGLYTLFGLENFLGLAIVPREAFKIR